jgi:YD repeat-containing protein
VSRIWNELHCNCDEQGHLLQIATPEGALNYGYEPVEGRRVRVYTANSDLRYTYDELGRIKTVAVVMRDGAVLPEPEVTTNTYTALGSLQDVYYPNGIHASYQYDGLMNRLTNLTYTSGSSVLLAQYSYLPNTNGQWKRAVEIQQQVGGTYATNQLGWYYDNLGRLTNETCGSTLATLNYTNRYVYNLVGNWIHLMILVMPCWRCRNLEPSVASNCRPGLRRRLPRAVSCTIAGSY